MCVQVFCVGFVVVWIGSRFMYTAHKSELKKFLFSAGESTSRPNFVVRIAPQCPDQFVGLFHSKKFDYVFGIGVSSTKLTRPDIQFQQFGLHLFGANIFDQHAFLFFQHVKPSFYESDTQFSNLFEVLLLVGNRIQQRCWGDHKGIDHVLSVNKK